MLHGSIARLLKRVFDMSVPVNEAVLEQTIKRCRERGIVVPTFAQMKNPLTAPAAVKAKLAKVGINEINPANLFRITWKNQPGEKGGFNDGNFVEFPSALTGVPARIVG